MDINKRVQNKDLLIKEMFIESIVSRHITLMQLHFDLLSWPNKPKDAIILYRLSDIFYSVDTATCWPDVALSRPS